jgi:hypothetical protein
MWIAAMSFVLEELLRPQRANAAPPNCEAFAAPLGADSQLALYDGDDRLVLFNRQYLQIDPKCAELLRIGARFEGTLRAGVQLGEFPEAAGREEEASGSGGLRILRGTSSSACRMEAACASRRRRPVPARPASGVGGRLGEVLLGDDAALDKWQEHLRTPRGHQPFRDFEYRCVWNTRGSAKSRIGGAENKGLTAG